MRDLTSIEREQVGGAFLANIGMGFAGMLGEMGLYAFQGGIRGQLSGSGFIGAGVGGFIYGASGFNPAAALAGVAIGAGVESAVSNNEDS